MIGAIIGRISRGASRVTGRLRGRPTTPPRPGTPSPSAAPSSAPPPGMGGSSNAAYAPGGVGAETHAARGARLNREAAHQARVDATRLTAGGLAGRIAAPFRSNLGKSVIGGAAAYMGGSAIKGFSEEVQKTPGFRDISDAGQLAFRASTFMVGTALQVKGVFGAAGGIAGAAGLARTSKVLNTVSNFASPVNLAKGMSKMGGKVVAGTAKMGVNTVRGTGAFAKASVQSTMTGLRHGPARGLDQFAGYIQNARNPYLGAMGVGMVAGGIRAATTRSQNERLTPRAAGAQAMNRSNYQRVSSRDRRMGV